MKATSVWGLISVLFLALGLSAWFILRLPGVAVAVLLSPPARPLLNNALQNQLDAGIHEKYFFQLVRAHRYAEARSLCTPELKSALSAASLEAQWAAFEKSHGRVTVWTETGDTTSLLPKYVEFQLRVDGTRGSGKAALRMVKLNGDWRIARVSVTP